MDKLAGQLYPLTVLALFFVHAPISEETSKQGGINVLSFDGGGSRGFMEIKSLDQMMKLATAMVRYPKRLLAIIIEDLELKENKTREEIWQLMSTIKTSDVIQPYEHFDYIVGKFGQM